jgi:hypothetical protein
LQKRNDPLGIRNHIFYYIYGINYKALAHQLSLTYLENICNQKNIFRKHLFLVRENTSFDKQYNQSYFYNKNTIIVNLVWFGGYEIIKLLFFAIKNKKLSFYYDK